VDRQDVAICGNGAAAVALFRALARNTTAPLAVTLLGPSAHFARGAAYATRDASHVLNVPAEKMSADADAPDQFAIGALTRGKWWEITAMPEIALQALRIARSVLARQGNCAWDTGARKAGRALAVS